MIKNLIYAMTAFLWLLTPLSGCSDRPLYDIPDVEEGETEVKIELNFTDFSPALNSRSAGDALQTVKTLWLVVYRAENGTDSDGKAYEGGDFVGKYSVSVNGGSQTHQPGEAADGSAGHAASGSLMLRNGTYRIYAVANMDLYDVEKPTEEELKNFKASWVLGSPDKNAEMFGVVLNADKSGSSSGASDNNNTVVIDETHNQLHAWLRRLASKITVAYDGSQLYDGVQVYIKSVTVRDIPATCPLQAQNAPASKDQLIEKGETVTYAAMDVYNDNYPALISNKTDQQYYPRRNKKAENAEAGSGPTDSSDAWNEWEKDPEAHSDNNIASLFFYENMQGVHEDKDKRQKPDDVNKGFIEEDNEKWKDGVSCGTYIEVEAFYNSTREGNIGSGTIKYRFMLGQNITTDYNAERNHHYQITLKLKNNANDIDWHIEYKKQILEVTQPKVFDYRGMVFMPDYTIPNLGHEFSPDNKLTVTSYEAGEGDDLTKAEFKDFTLEYEHDGGSGKPDWLEVSSIELPSGAEDDKDPRRIITFNAKSDFTEVDIDAKLKSNSAVTGTRDNPYNLASPGNPGKIDCTANCYIVSAPGWYMLPLVYGNAMHHGEDNTSAYTYTGIYEGDNILKKFKNHADKEIESPYIIDSGETPDEAQLVWQDEPNLVHQYYGWDTNEHVNNPYIKSDAYPIPGTSKNAGALVFYVPADIKQGNAVIAVGKRFPDKSDGTPDYTDRYNYDGGRSKMTVMWSWHIWVTDLSGFDKTIKVTANDPTRKFDLMPVNLGWCSDHGQKIKYYPKKTCRVRFRSGDLVREITIERESHTALPLGNNPYYQWGRKDPFIAAVGSSADANKKKYDGPAELSGNPPRLSPDDSDNDQRFTTREALWRLIQHPDTWHNPPRQIKPGFIVGSTNPWASDNKTYANLWQGRIGNNPTAPTLKTIYDPCPVGYQVCHYNAFTGFTTTGEDPGVSQDKGNGDVEDLVSRKWYNVRYGNILEGNPKGDELYEFYTDQRKVKSIIFPVLGYRDWDDFCNIYKYKQIGYVWAAGNVRNDDNSSYNFEFSRWDTMFENSYVRPKNSFYPCDGFPVRPAYYESDGAHQH